MSRLSAVEKYAQPAVVEFWRRLSEQGLQACEEKMLARYAPPPARVLDLGCGAGRAGLALTPQGYQVTGIDLVWEMVRAAHDLHERAQLAPRLAQADIRAIPCADARYDAALIFIAAIQHITGRSARQRALAEIARVLRSGGVLILALDNLAPALTCYAWWSWRRLTSAVRRSAPAATPAAGQVRAAAADRMLESRRDGASPWVWHARGIARTLRWRTWNGLIDIGRRARIVPGEIGDTRINQVSLTPTPGSVYYHIYRHDELVEDAAAAGFELTGYHTGRELDGSQEFARRVRQLDKQVLYAFRRP